MLTSPHAPTAAAHLILFGGTGDLVMRKLLPALCQLHSENLLDANSRIIGAARQNLDHNAWRSLASEQCAPNLNSRISPQQWQDFSQRLDYCQVDATQLASFQTLSTHLATLGGPRVFYLSTAPALFADICRHLHQSGLIQPDSRVIIEKPLGHDLASSQAINDEVGEYFTEPQIFRIDHYLGKEPVQNLLALRFGNVLFEPLWRREWVRDVQITVSEKLGIERRGAFYDTTGALRDMVQNHLLQLLCIVAMEPPSAVNADSVRDEKLKVLRALRPITGNEVLQKTVRGQYKAGAIDGRPVVAYLEEADIPSNSHTETFVAIKAQIDSWRWAGVPFYLRTGKRMQDKLAEIVINFRPLPHSIFGDAAAHHYTNRMIIRMQPEETVKLYMMSKRPGDTMRLEPVALDLDFSEAFGTRQLAAYARLLLDSLRGNLTLFVRRDEQEAAWRWVEPIMQEWANSSEPPKGYTAGTWGPAASSALLGRDDLAWHEES